MPFGTLKLKPGVDVIETPTLNAAQLTESMCIRFYKGLPQKRGGWAHRSNIHFAGRANELHGFSNFSFVSFLAVGTSTPAVQTNLYISDVSGGLTDITPSPAPPPGRQWSVDNFGEILVALVVNQKIYTWTPTDPAAVPMGGSSPTRSSSILVVPQVEMVAALGSETGGIFNPLLVRWCDAGNYLDWTPTATNQAGSYVIPQGSYIVGGYASGLTVLIWTDIGVTAMTYQGLPFVFGFQPLATGCGLFGRRTKAVIGTRVMWLAGKGGAFGEPTAAPIGFFQMSLGATAPQPMECDVWDIFFDNAWFANPGAFFMGVTEEFSEFELFFPLSPSSPFFVPNSVEFGSIKYNTIENVWDYTISPQMQRTAWESVTPVGPPVGADLTGLLQQHEQGYNADGAGMVWSWQTGDFDLGNGEEMIFVDWLLPDFTTTGNPTINLTVGASISANDTTPVTKTMAVTSSTDWTANFALRGRQFFIGASGSDRGTFNRLGAVRYRAAPDGRGP